MRVIGILGGTFDPVHVAHIAMADAFATALGLDEVRFLPASQPWQKTALHATGRQRLDMLHAAIDAHRETHEASAMRFVVDARELERPGKTYTIDTLRAMRAELGPTVSMIFLIGADQLEHLDTWKDWVALWDYAHLAAVSRPGFSLTNVPADVAREWTTRAADVATIRSRAAGHSFLLEGLALDVSATDIRTALALPDRTDAARVARLVPRGVLDYIQLHRLYRN